MSEQLERQIRRDTDALAQGLSPIEDLLPEDMAKEFGIHQDKPDKRAFRAQPEPRRPRPGWQMAALALVAVLIAAIPALLWFGRNTSDVVDESPVTTTETTVQLPGATVSVEATGTVASDDGNEILSFTISATGGQPLDNGVIPAIGTVELSTESTVEPTWFLEGTVVCVRPVTETIVGESGQGLWEIRYSATLTNNPESDEGEYASFYLRDAAQPAARHSALSDPNADPSCGPRAVGPLSPILTGMITVNS